VRNERGFALVAVILILALLGILVGEFAFSMRLEATMARAFRDQVLAVHLAEAAVQGKVDRLIRLKENVIIGRLIPAGESEKKQTVKEAVKGD